MVKLFKRKSKVEAKDFKFDTSLKLKALPLEEYAHVSYAFQVAILRFERMLKESLLEGYITSTTLEKISQELNLSEIRSLEIPDMPSLQTIFGSEAASATPKKPVAEVISPTKSVNIPKTKTPVPESIAPEAPTVIPPTITPTEPFPDTKPTQPSISTEPPKTRPTISFSFPESPTEPKEVTPSPTPTPTPTTQITPPTIPKISFPSKPTTPPSISPLPQSSRGREEDRATGIAILRKQMLTELKKIRSVVSEQDQ
ncbi:MAG: hypothetical protein ACFFFH_03070 [Candidatus Thorarchaeota archaeon]